MSSRERVAHKPTRGVERVGKVALSFQLRTVERDLDAGTPPHWVMVGPRDEFMCYGIMDSYPGMEIILKLAALATRVATPAQLAEAGVGTMPKLELPHLPPQLDKRETGSNLVVIGRD